MTKVRTHIFRYKKECHNCTRNTHRLIATVRFGVVCRKCYKKEFNYLVELYNDLVGHCRHFTIIITEKELCDYLTDLDTVLDGIKTVWEQIYDDYYGTHKTEFEEIYNNMTRNEKACQTAN